MKITKSDFFQWLRLHGMESRWLSNAKNKGYHLADLCKGEPCEWIEIGLGSIIPSDRPTEGWRGLYNYWQKFLKRHGYKSLPLK